MEATHPKPTTTRRSLLTIAAAAALVATGALVSSSAANAATTPQGPVSGWAYSAPALGVYTDVVDAQGNRTTDPTAPTPTDFSTFGMTGPGVTPGPGVSVNGAPSGECINPAFALSSAPATSIYAPPGELPSQNSFGNAHFVPVLNLTLGYSLPPDPTKTYSFDVTSLPCAQQLGFTGEIYPAGADPSGLTATANLGPDHNAPTITGSTTGTISLTNAPADNNWASVGVGPWAAHYFWAHTTAGSQVLVLVGWSWPRPARVTAPATPAPAPAPAPVPSPSAAKPLALPPVVSG
jgi:hypothetical protein